MLLHERRHVVHRAVDDDVDVVEFVVRCYVGGGEGFGHSDCGEGGGGDGGEGGGKDRGGYGKGRKECRGGCFERIDGRKGAGR